MQNRQALVIFNPEFEKEARSYVKQYLQYQLYYEIVHMLPVPPNQGDTTTLTEETLNNFLKAMKLNVRGLDCILIRKQEALSPEAGDECFNDDVVKFFKKFPNRNVVLTYNLDQAQITDGQDTGKKLGTLKLKKVREKKRNDTDNGIPGHQFKQVGLARTPSDLPDNPHPTPNFKYYNLTAEGIRLRNASKKFLGSEKPPHDHQTKLEEYKITIQSIIMRRQRLIASIYPRVEENYADPVCYAEKLANLFHAYATNEPAFPHQPFAQKIADSFYELAKNAESPSVDWSFEKPADELHACLTCLANHLIHNRTEIDPKGAFQALLYAAKQLITSEEILQVGYLIDEDWEEKITALIELAKQKLDYVGKSCVNDLIIELQRLRGEKISTAKLLRACESITNIINNPSDETHSALSEVIRSHSWSNVFIGLGLCLLGLSMIAAVGLTIGLTGGTAMIAAPALMIATSVAIALVGMGIRKMVDSTSNPIPFNDKYGMLFFGRKPIQHYTDEIQPVALFNPA